MKETFQTVALWFSLCGLAALVAFAAFAALRGELRRHRPTLVALAFVLVAAYVGGTKHNGSITYPATDVTQSYITDAGSYVTNDAVVVRFSYVVAPASADFILDAVPLDATNAAERAARTVTVVESTLGAYGDGEPHRVEFAAATNYNWYGYTTWTPGSSVTTNGVWHLPAWPAATDGTLAEKSANSIVPVRTRVRKN